MLLTRPPPGSAAASTLELTRLCRPAQSNQPETRTCGRATRRHPQMNICLTVRRSGTPKPDSSACDKKTTQVAMTKTHGCDVHHENPPHRSGGRGVSVVLRRKLCNPTGHVRLPVEVVEVRRLHDGHWQVRRGTCHKHGVDLENCLLCACVCACACVRVRARVCVFARGAMMQRCAAVVTVGRWFHPGGDSCLVALVCGLRRKRPRLAKLWFWSLRVRSFVRSFVRGALKAWLCLQLLRRRCFCWVGWSWVGWMDGWMNGWSDGWMDGWMVGSSSSCRQTMSGR